MCASLAKASEPFWAGYGCDGVGFTCCDVPEEELLPPTPNAALVILENGSLSVEQMEEELKDLVDEDWDWHVQKLNESDFAMFFPSKESLRMAIRGGGLTLPSSKLHVIVATNSGDPAAAEQLVEVWGQTLRCSATISLGGPHSSGRPRAWLANCGGRKIFGLVIRADSLAARIQTLHEATTTLHHFRQLARLQGPRGARTCVNQHCGSRTTPTTAAPRGRQG
jgi:hypothetical protein